MSEADAINTIVNARIQLKNKLSTDIQDTLKYLNLNNGKLIKDGQPQSENQDSTFSVVLTGLIADLVKNFSRIIEIGNVIDDKAFARPQSLQKYSITPTELQSMAFAESNIILNAVKEKYVVTSSKYISLYNAIKAAQSIEDIKNIQGFKLLPKYAQKRILNGFEAINDKTTLLENTINAVFQEDIKKEVKNTQNNSALLQVYTLFSLIRKQSNILNGRTKKKWVHLGGGVVDRPHHVKLNGNVKEINQKFVINSPKNGVVLMDAPHDKNAPIGETINCHCIALYY